MGASLLVLAKSIYYDVLYGYSLHTSATKCLIKRKQKQATAKNNGLEAKKMM